MAANKSSSCATGSLRNCFCLRAVATFAPMKTELRGFAPTLILESISRVEQRLGLSEKQTASVYHQLDYWLVQPRYLRTCFKALGKADSPVLIP